MPESLSLDKPLAIIGDEDITAGFKALGFKAYTVKEPGGFKAVLDEAVSQRPAVCLLQEEVYRASYEQIDSYRNLPTPVFIPFSKRGKTALLDNIIRSMKLRATGTF